MADICVHGTDGSITQSEQKRSESNSEDATAKAAMDPGRSTVSPTADTLHDTTSSTDPSSSRLLTLPWEIRQEILELALPYPDAAWIDCGEHLWYLGSTDVLRTCQQLHVEGTTVLYSRNPLCMVISPELYTPLDYHHIDPFFSFRGYSDCPNCLNEDNSTEECFSDQDPVDEYSDREVSPERLGMANIILTRDWLLQIRGEEADEIWEDAAGRLCGLPNARKTQNIQDLVNQVTEKYLRQARRLRKVTVVWKWQFDGFAAHPTCVEFREAAVKPLKDLGVPIGEMLLYDGFESETSGAESGTSGAESETSGD